MKITVTIHIFNEEGCLVENVRRVTVFLEAHYKEQYELVISDNVNDRTIQIARAIAQQHNTVRVLHLDAKGRGRALKQSWRQRTDL